MDFFVASTVAFASAMAALPWVAPELVDYFYGLTILALVHTLVLGWITAAIMGVMYWRVPAFTRSALPYPRLLMPQLVVYLIGVSGVVSHFALGSWSGVWSAGLVTIAGILMFAANIAPLLWRYSGRGTRETGLLTAVAFLLVAATLGFMLALDKDHAFLGGSMIPNLASHAHLGALGWITMAIFVLSNGTDFECAPPEVPKSERAGRMMPWVLAVATAGLATTLLTGLPGLMLWSALIGASLAAWMVLLYRGLGAPGKLQFLEMRHLAAATVWLLAALALGVSLSITGAGTEVGARLAASYGVAAIPGWMGNIVLGLSRAVFPGCVARVRALRGWEAAAPGDSSRAETATFLGYNLGLLMVVAAVLDGSTILARAGGVSIAAGGLVYAADMRRTLGPAYRRGVPRAGR